MDNAGKEASDTFMLNAKFLLILLVVIANCLEPLIDQNRAVNTLYLSIYTFHIPMFVFAMGYFAKGFRFDGSGLKSLRTIFHQYLVFQSIYSLMDVLVFHAPGIRYSFFIPYSLLWFLFSHLCWRLLLRVFVSFKHPLAAAFAIGILAGYLPFSGAILSFSRTLVFFPFFLAGYYFRFDGEWPAKIRALRGPGIVAAGAIAIALYAVPLDPKWLYSSFTYSQLNAAGWAAGAYRLGIYALQIAASVCFLSFVPRMRSILTSWGPHTGYVFLLQGLVIKTAIATGIYAYVSGPLHVALVLLAAGVLTWMLSQAWVRRLSRPLIEPDLDRLNRAIFHHYSVRKKT